MTQEQSGCSKDAHLPDAPISAEQVARYLVGHPDFFTEHQELLLELELRHHCQPASSLIERQVELLRQHNADMKSRLADLFDIARRNDRLFARSRCFVLAIQQAQTLDEVVAVAKESLTVDFGIDFVVLLLEAEPETEGPLLRHCTAEELKALWGQDDRTVRYMTEPRELRQFFVDPLSEIRSAALLPIHSGQRQLGLMALASRKEEDFQPVHGRLFLEFVVEMMGQVMAPFMSRPVCTQGCT